MSTAPASAITIFSHNLAGNCLGRALVFADCLKEHMAVRVVGPLRDGASVWRVAQDYRGADILPVRFHKHPLHHSTQQRMVDLIQGEWVIAVKPYPSSFGSALLAKRQRGAKVLLDLDDDEEALLTYGKSLRQRYLHTNPDKLAGVRRMLRRRGDADAITTASLTLNRRFGGEMLPHMRDPRLFPRATERAALRAEAGLPPDTFILAHLGSFRPHKGLEKIVEALDLLADPRVVLAYTANSDKLPRRDWIVRIPEFPLHRLPHILGGCDLAVFPSVDSPITRSQLPAKLIDAMMAGVPFLVSRTESVAHVVQDEDLLMEMDATPRAIAERLSRFLGAPEVLRQKAAHLRERAEREYSIEAGLRILRPLMAAEARL